MSFQPNNYQQNYDELTRNVISNSGGMKNNLLKGRKKGVPIDKQKLYEENYQLRNKVKELQQTNLKLKTQLIVTEKQKEQLFNMAQEQMFHPKIPQRSHSGSHKGSSANPLDNKTNFTLLKQKQNSAIKKLVRDKHSENEQLRFQNQNIKKTMKFTRLSELIAQNNELIEETKRLRLQVIESRNYIDQFGADYSNKIQSLKRELQQERDTEKKNGNQLKKQFEVTNQLREKLRESQLKKVQIERRLNRQLKALKSQNLDLQSRISNQLIARQCGKPQCIKLKKQKYELKRKVDQQQKQIKYLKDQQLIAKRQLMQRQYYYKNNVETNSNNKKTQHQKRVSQPSQQKVVTNNSIVSQKQQSQNYRVQLPKTEIIPIKNNQPKQQVQKQIPKEKEKAIIQGQSLSLASQKSKQSHAQPNKIEPKVDHIQQEKKVENNKASKKQKTIQLKKKTEKQNQSYDTQKLLESYEDSHQNKQKTEQKQLEQYSKLDKQINQQQQYYKESQGQYQQIDFQQEQQPVKQKKQKEEKPSSKKQTSKKKDKQPLKATQHKEQKLNIKQQKVTKSKSTKKVNKNDQGEQVLQDKKQQNEDDSKSELKIIKQTLTYKFNAQGYTYDDLAKDLNQSKTKTFSVTQMMDILTEQPFLLSQEHIEAIIIYLFQTDNLTGEETIPTKNFLKKIKKFIAKAKIHDKQTQEHNLSELIAIIQTDEAGKKKIRNQCKKYDSGNGMINKQNFIKIMQGMKIGNELLETATAQIVYVSTDINNLNYDFFLKRFAEAQ